MNFLSQFMMMSSAILAASPTDDEALFTTPGTFSWTVPPKVRTVSVVCIGGGATPAVSLNNNPGGGGGALVYANNILVTPGESYTVVIGKGGDSQGSATNPLTGENGGLSSFTTDSVALIANGGFANGNPGTFSGGDGGGQGGSSNASQGYGGGGAGGYSGEGGSGGQGGNSSVANPGDDGAGGAGGGGGGSFAQSFSSVQPGRASSGGGTGVYGQSSDGTGGLGATSASGLGNATSAGGGSGGTNGDLNGGLYGGGGRSGFTKLVTPILYLAGGSGGGGAVRIIWPGNVRQFPSLNTQEI